MLTSNEEKQLEWENKFFIFPRFIHLLPHNDFEVQLLKDKGLKFICRLYKNETNIKLPPRSITRSITEKRKKVQEKLIYLDDILKSNEKLVKEKWLTHKGFNYVLSPPDKNKKQNLYLSENNPSIEQKTIWISKILIETLLWIKEQEKEEEKWGQIVNNFVVTCKDFFKRILFMLFCAYENPELKDDDISAVLDIIGNLTKYCACYLSSAC